MKYIILDTKDKFNEVMKLYGKTDKWQLYLWNFFKENTCYIPEEDSFINLEKAKLWKLQSSKT